MLQFETVEQKVRTVASEKDRKSMHQFGAGEEDVVYTTRLKVDPKTGKYIIMVPSPLKEYGFSIAQYSLTDRQFDEATKKQISARQEAYQLAEQTKATVTKANSDTIQAVETGRAKVAEVEAEMKQELKTKVVAAEQEVGVAEQKQQEEVNVAEQALATAEQAMLEAKQVLANSQIEVKKAEAEAAKMLADAKAEQAKLERGGSLAAVAELRAKEGAKRRMALAKGASKIPAPRNVVYTSSKGGGGGEMGSMIQMWMLKSVGAGPPAVQPQK